MNPFDIPDTPTSTIVILEWKILSHASSVRGLVHVITRGY
jgi:hypothetical protein